MPTPKLQTKKGTRVAEWSVRPAELKALHAAKPPKAEKIQTLAPRVKQSELRVVPDKFTDKDLLVAERRWPLYFCKPLYRVRKNQKNLTPTEWQRFIHAIEALAASGMPSPTYHEFVQIHIDAMDTAAGMMWGAHGGRNFLSWHREYLAKIEARLIAINPLVTLPYWDWVTDRTAIPAALTNPADLAILGDHSRCFLQWKQPGERRPAQHAARRKQLQRVSGHAGSSTVSQPAACPRGRHDGFERVAF